MKTCKVFCFLFLLSSTVGCSQGVISKNSEQAHHTESGFSNIPHVETASSKGALFVLRRIWGSAFHPKVPQGHRIEESLALSQLNELAEHNTITWLGHSTFLLRIDGKTILTDPFLTDRASPFSFVGGITRYVPPGISIKNLPQVDIVVISHNHYDHLDLHTLCALPNRSNIDVFIPLGLKSSISGCGYQKIHELDWWQGESVRDLNITALPSAHDSGRSLTDKDETLWASWVIESAGNRYFFSGDTGYSPVFKDIGAAYGDFNLAIVPIGAYAPRELMWMSHVTPEEAVDVGKDINAKTIVGGHWGTIELSDEDHWEPPTRFISAGKNKGMSEDSIWVMKIGETRILP